MPHGAGHAGGHHGGGGYHHGGGFHHHHHHRHHFGGYAYGGPYYRYGYRHRSLGWGFFWLVIFGSAITLAVVFSLRYGLPEDNSGSTNYAPNETRAISYSSILCDSISINSKLTGIKGITTGMFSILSQTPPLSDHDTFTVTNSPNFFTVNYQQWNYYLYPGSTLAVSACKHNFLSNFGYFLIKGENNFKSWINNPRSSVAKQYSSISALCSSGKDQLFPYTVETEGVYYLVFYLYSSSDNSDDLDISFNVSRTKYAINPDNVLSNCSLSNTDEDCTLDIPLDFSIAVLALSSSGEIDWSSDIPIDVDCNARVWVYVAISLVCVASFVLFVVCIVACCCFYLRRNKNKYASLGGKNQPTPVTEEAPAPTTATYMTGNEAGNGAPPPYNPSYGTQY